MRKFQLIAGIAALAAAQAAFAEPQTRTVTIDTPKVEGSKTVTRDKEAGTLSRDAELTRKSDGATASREYDRQRNENGVVVSGEQTMFNGDTRSYEYSRTRTDNGSVASGSFTNANGKTFEYDARTRRDENDLVRRQVIRNENGDPVAARKTRVHRSDNGTVTRRTVSRKAPGFNRPRSRGR